MKRIILCGVIFAAILLNVESQVYVRQENLWNIYLEKNVECSLLLFQDGTLVVSTLYMDYVTVIPTDIFKKNKIDTLLIVLHNHLTLDRWSEMDEETNHWLRNKGYAGPILLRLGNNKVIRWED